jgi:hypothetical protein
MPAVLLVVYGVPLYNVSAFWINVEILAERDAQGRILSIYYSEVNNVNLLFLIIILKK